MSDVEKAKRIIWFPFVLGRIVKILENINEVVKTLSIVDENSYNSLLNEIPDDIYNELVKNVEDAMPYLPMVVITKYLDKIIDSAIKIGIKAGFVYGYKKSQEDIRNIISMAMKELKEREKKEREKMKYIS